MLTSLVFLYQGNVKTPEKSMIIVNIDGENLHYLLNVLRNVFNEIFRKDVNYDNIESHIKPKPGLHPLSRRYIF